MIDNQNLPKLQLSACHPAAQIPDIQLPLIWSQDSLNKQWHVELQLSPNVGLLHSVMRNVLWCVITTLNFKTTIIRFRIYALFIWFYYFWLKVVLVVVALRPRSTAMGNAGRSVNLTTLFLGSLITTKRLTSTQCPVYRQ